MKNLIPNQKINSFKDLDVWKQAYNLVIEVYIITKKFPRDEQFGLVSQMRRAAVSVTSNIAEGFVRKSYKDKAHFYNMSKGSLAELQDQLLISKDVGYIDELDYNKIETDLIRVQMILSKFIQKTESFI
ncbi:four helix bundle protein [Candidatus Uhrbacteria bacterium]|nr:four helix bundle protein [Candidatus Uhrbacteria bacterium]